MLNIFIWGNKRARIRQTILEKDICGAGLAIPNVKCCYYAAILSACLYWWHVCPGNINMKLEQQQCNMTLFDWLSLDKESRKKVENGERNRVLERMWSRVQK